MEYILIKLYLYICKYNKRLNKQFCQMCRLYNIEGNTNTKDIHIEMSSECRNFDWANEYYIAYCKSMIDIYEKNNSFYEIKNKRIIASKILSSYLSKCYSSIWFILGLTLPYVVKVLFN